MQYCIITQDFGTPMYFMHHPGKGFKLGSVKDDAKTYLDDREVIQEAMRLREESGMETDIEKM
jgi:hypothetical protein